MPTCRMELWGTVCQLSDHTVFGCRALKGDSPMVPGHEFVGDVVAVGPDEQIWSVGDRAGGGWHGGHDRTTTNNTTEYIVRYSPEHPQRRAISANEGFSKCVNKQPLMASPDTEDVCFSRSFLSPAYSSPPSLSPKTSR